MISKMLASFDRSLWTQRRSQRRGPAASSAPPALDITLLEERILFSAVPLAEPLEASPEALDSTESLSDESTASEPTAIDGATSNPEESLTEEPVAEPSDSLLAADAGWKVSRELVFIDASVDDLEQLLDSLLAIDDPQRDIQIILLSSDRDGIEQISEELARHQNLDAVHVLSHGREGALTLGAGELSNSSLDRYASQLATWADAFHADTDLLLYGCDLAANEGATLVDALSALCNCDVAASDDLTGHTSLGGDWEFEYLVGAIETGAILSTEAIDAWHGLLSDANQAPVNTVPGAQSINQDGMVLFSSATGTAITVSDADAADSPLEVTLTTTNGTFNLTGTRGLTFSTGDGSEDTVMTFTGTLTDINAAFEGGTFVALAGFSGTGEIEITTNDLGNTGTGGAQSDTDTVAITVAGSTSSLWMTFENDDSSTDNTDIPTITGGDIVSYDGASFAPATTTGTFSYQFNLDNIAGTDGDTRVSGVHYVSSNISVGSNALQLLTGDLILTVDADENISGVTYHKEDIFVFRPTTEGDYTAGSFFMLVDGSDIGLGKVNAVSLVEQTTVVAGTTLNAGELLISHDGSNKRIFHYSPGSLGDTSTGSLSMLIKGEDIDIGTAIGGIHLVQRNTALGDVALTAGQLLVTLKGDQSAIGDAPTISAARQDIFILNVTSTGDGTTAATATKFFVGADESLDGNPETIWGVTLFQTPIPTMNTDTLAVDEHSAAGTSVGVVSGSAPSGQSISYAIVAGNSGGAFAIDALTGEITVNNTSIMNFEATPVFSLTVAAINEDGAYGTATITVNLNDINDAPTLDSSGTMTLSTITEDDTANTGQSVASIIASAGGDRIVDEDAGAVEGIAITATDSGNGTWEYSLNGSGIWSSVGSVTNNSALLLRATDLVRFVPNGQSGTSANITFRAWDQTSGTVGTKVDAGSGGGTTAFSTGTETASITITSVNDEEVLSTNTGTTVDEGSSGNVISTAMLETTDIDHSAAQLVYTLTSAPDYGVLRLSGIALGINDTFTQADIDAGLITFDHDGSEAPSDTFEFTVDDGEGTSTSGAFSLSVNPINDSPTIATNTGATVDEGSTGNTITTTMLNEGDPDDSGSGLTYTITVATTNGTLRLSGVVLGLNDTFTQADIDGGLVTYDHDGSETLSDSFNFELADGGEHGAVPATGTFNFSVTPVNDEEVLSTNTGTTVDEGSAGNVINNSMLETTDADHSAAQLVYTLTSAPDNGVLRLSGNALGINDTFTQADINAGLITFDHDGSETLSDTFEFTVDDGEGTSTSGTFSLSVNPINDDPFDAGSLPGTIVVIEDVASNVDISSIDLVDPDAAGNEISVSLSTSSGGNLIAAAGTGITITGNNSGALTLTGTLVDLNTYFDNASSIQYLHSIEHTNGSGADSIALTVNDHGNSGAGGGNDIQLATITVDITPVNDTPTAHDAALSMLEDGILNGNVAAYVADVDGDPLSILLTGTTSHGTLSLAGDGSFTYTPNTNFYGVDHFTYRAFDGLAESVEATVTISVTAVNDPPVAEGENYTVRSNEALILDAAEGLLANDVDVEDDDLSVLLVEGPSRGSLNLRADGSFEYVSFAGYFGPDSFSYVVTDGDKFSEPVTVSITVLAVGTGTPAPDNGDSAQESDDNSTAAVIEFQQRTLEKNVSSSEQQAGERGEKSQEEHGYRKMAGRLRSALTEDSREDTTETEPPKLIASRAHTPNLHDNATFTFLESYGGWATTYDPAQLQFTLDEFSQQADARDDYFEMMAGSSGAVFAGVTAAGTVWFVYSSYLAAMLSSALPVWARFDPIYVVQNKLTIDEDDASIASIIEQGEKPEDPAT